MGGSGGGAYVPRGQHPNTNLALQKVAQGKLESKYPAVLQYKNSFEQVPDDVVVDKDTIKAYNKDVIPKPLLKVTEPLTVKQFKNLIDQEVIRRQPTSNTKLTAEKLDAFNSPGPKKGKKSDTSGSLSPKLAIQGMISHNNPESSK